MGCILEKKSLSSEYDEVRVCALCYELVYSRVMLACTEIGGEGGKGDGGDGLGGGARDMCDTADTDGGNLKTLAKRVAGRATVAHVRAGDGVLRKAQADARMKSHRARMRGDRNLGNDPSVGSNDPSARGRTRSRSQNSGGSRRSDSSPGGSPSIASQHQAISGARSPMASPFSPLGSPSPTAQVSPFVGSSMRQPAGSPASAWDQSEEQRRIEELRQKAQDHRNQMLSMSKHA